MQFDPNELEHTVVYKLLTGSIIPRPIGWISSISQEGINNLAPFSYFNAVGDDPPHVMFATSRNNNTNKDTLNNVQIIRIPPRIRLFSQPISLHFVKYYDIASLYRH